VERLDEAECLRLLGLRGLGRLVHNRRYGPMALPVEYTMHEGSVVFRTTQDTFTDEDLRTGIAHASILSAGVEPWIEGEPEHAIRINPTRIWGHRIRLPAGSNPAVSAAGGWLPC
jgi:Pyridoxamine 5'-phosphate oxidase